MQFKQNGNAVADVTDDSKAKIDFTIHFCSFFCRILEQKTTKSEFDVFIYVLSSPDQIRSNPCYSMPNSFHLVSNPVFCFLSSLCCVKSLQIYTNSRHNCQRTRQNDASSIESLCIFSFLICIM